MEEVKKHNREYKVKQRIQLLVWIIEGLIIPLIIVYLFNGFKFQVDKSVYETIFNISFLEAFLLITSIYQLLLFLFNKNRITSEKDMILLLITFYKKLELYLENNKEESIEELFLVKIEFEKNEHLIHQNFINEMKRSEEYISSEKDIKEKLFFVKEKIIKLEHNYELKNLDWNNSLLLRLLK